MTKVVINNCWGGFGLSTEAMKGLIERNCSSVREYTIDEYTGGEGLGRWGRNEDVGDGYETAGLEDVLVKGRMVYTYDNAQRTDPVLVALIEEWGSRRVSGQLAKLRVVDVPDGIRYEIDDYDGMESIHESHQTWR